MKVVTIKSTLTRASSQYIGAALAFDLTLISGGGLGSFKPLILLVPTAISRILIDPKGYLYW